MKPAGAVVGESSNYKNTENKERCIPKWRACNWFLTCTPLTIDGLTIYTEFSPDNILKHSIGFREQYCKFCSHKLLRKIQYYLTDERRCLRIRAYPTSERIHYTVVFNQGLQIMHAIYKPCFSTNVIDNAGIYFQVM